MDTSDESKRRDRRRLPRAQRLQMANGKPPGKERKTSQTSAPVAKQPREERRETSIDGNRQSTWANLAPLAIIFLYHMLLCVSSNACYTACPGFFSESALS